MASRGLLYFGCRQTDGKLVAVQDNICLRVVSPNGQAVLVQATPLSSASSTHGGGLSWPGMARRLDESTWDTARRVARTVLQMEDTSLHMGHNPSEAPIEQ